MIKSHLQSARLLIVLLVRLSLVLGFCLLSSLFFSTSSFAANKPNINAKPDAKAIYDHWCAQCHGYEGRADGINSTPDMAINPRDHTDRNFMITRSDDQFEDVIRGGGTRAAKSPLMPPWEHTLTDAEIKSLVAYLRVLCKCEYEGVVSHEKLRGVDPNFK